MRNLIGILLIGTMMVCSPAGMQAQKGMAGKTLTRAGMARDLQVIKKTLEKNHPFLYKYVHRDTFERRFDSLLNNLPDEIPSADFYLTASQLVYSLRHGHMLLYPGKPDSRIFRSHIMSKFRYEFYDSALYIVNNEPGTGGIRPGTRIDRVNGKDIRNLSTRYIEAVPMEGYTGNLRQSLFGMLLPIFIGEECGETDSLTLNLSYLDSAYVLTLATYQKSSQEGLGDLMEEFRKAFDPEVESDSSGLYASGARLKFLDEEKRVAILTVDDFMQSHSALFRRGFAVLDSLNTEHLILDLRNNLGGVLLLTGELQSYLWDSAFHLIEPPVVGSVLRIFYPPGSHWVQHFFSTLVLPFQFALYSPIRKRSDEGYSFNAVESRLKTPSMNRFKGSITVLVNGGTYSAASILAANLKYGRDYLLIGEETGGASEGTVALRLGTVKLPNSGFYLRYGIGYLQPIEKGGEEGRGVMPDIRIIPTLKDRIDGIDPELRYALKILQRGE
ncbi:MAG TPA: S41 family peptidase [Bacteroidales bacterium]|nr:S41 family peptidase [Bacteroidales bacterium]HRZ47807.1 S41 family peptidase [Bacteroidales bacterium]